jgi:diacylglycerol kinase family enzyme
MGSGDKGYPMGEHLHVLFNHRSGTAGMLGITAATLREKLEGAGYSVTVDDEQDAPLEQRVAAAARSKSDAVVVAGGDGTVTAMAEAAVETGKPMLILPMGTANLLARDLSLPLEIDAWVAALPTMVERRIDIGRVNGRLFLHKVVVGFAPAIAAGREKLRGRMDMMGKFALLRFMIRRLLRSRRFAIEFRRDDGSSWVERVQSVAVANNMYDEGFGKVFAKAKLDDGLLGLYILKHLNVLDFIRLVTGMVIGNWTHDEALDVQTVDNLIVRTKRRRLKAMVDGEVMSLFSPLLFSVEPQALVMLAPPLEQEAEAPAPAPTEALATA